MRRAVDKLWLRSYPQGTPAEIDAGAYPSLIAIFEESCRKLDTPRRWRQVMPHNMGKGAGSMKEWREEEEVSRSATVFERRSR